MVFKIIEKKKNIFESLIIYAAIFCILGLVFSAIFDIISSFIICFCIVFLLILIWLILKQNGFIIKYTTIGKLILSEKSIIISILDNPDVVYEITEKTNILINYRGYTGLSLNNYYCYGDSNEMKFEKNLHGTNVRFLAENAQQIEGLRNLMRVWYQSKVAITETGINGRNSFLLNTDLNYRALQKAKLDIGLTI